MNSIWIARDKEGTLYVYKEKPKRGLDMWLDAAHYEFGGTSKELNPNWFTDLRWEDEPIELVIKGKED